uniref:Uncharacterized protein n=1 Tax=Anguilla anguilla TaxID=7936 RepID=A0A0E9SBQ7_ANGAN
MTPKVTKPRVRLQELSSGKNCFIFMKRLRTSSARLG